MRHLPLALLAGFSLAFAGPAQVGTGIGWTKNPSPSFSIIKAFNSVPAVQGTGDVRHVSHAKLSNNGPGVWTTAVTAKDLMFFGGNSASVGIMIGIYNPSAGTFMATMEGQNLNSALDDMRCTLSPDGLWAMLERSDGNVYLASRAAVGTQFNAPVTVSGFGSLTDVYPNLGQVGGQWKCFYSDGTSIVMQDIDLAGATLTGSPQVVANAIQPGAVPISPTPVIGPDGDVEALWMSEVVVPRTSPFIGDADPCWHNDLDPTTPGVIQIQRTDYQCCGSLAGGYVNFSHDINPSWHVMHGEGAWMTGDSTPIGGTADIMTAAIHKNPGSPLFSALLFGLGHGPAVSIPPFQGKFALSGMSSLSVAFSTTGVEGIATIAFPIPNNPQLQGLSLALQCAVLNFTQGTTVFTKTAWLHMK